MEPAAPLSPRALLTRHPWIAAAMLATLAGLLAHAWEYRFLTDDAFISFRYARNLADGWGLVFNPGGERVEGYTNFLWVVTLAAFSRAGLPPEIAANILGFVLTAVLWVLLALYVLRDPPSPAHRWAMAVPLIFLALTRSVAVWSTGGLETRLYEVLVVAGVLSLIAGIESRSSSPFWIAPGALLGLAALTRPDGALVGGCALAMAAVTELRRQRRPPWLISSTGAFAVIVLAHYVARRAYYGEWLPNTYYAKVSATWWDMGVKYLLLFVLEHAIWLWIPLLVAAVSWHRDRGTTWRVGLIAAIVLPHALFIASVGGDHFEYRPVDLYFLLTFPLLYDGTRRLLRAKWPRAAVAAYLALVSGGLIALPWLSRGQFPRDQHRAGLPGGLEMPEAKRFMAADRLGPYSLPGLSWLGRSYATLLRETTASFVGIRAEEHELFLATVVPEGKALGRMVATGTLPADTHIAIDCVGAIPYYSNLKVLDRLGLTDRYVARLKPTTRRLMAHQSRAGTVEYAVKQGVDMWSADSVHLRWEAGHERLKRLVATAHLAAERVHVAEADDGSFLVAYLLIDPFIAARRFPRLRFYELTSEADAERLIERIDEVRAQAAPRASD